jgi:hypothetical protein
LARREADWLKRSWCSWEVELEGWIDEHHLSRKDETVLRLLWFEEARHYDWLWRRYRAYHRFLRVTWIVTGVLTPLLIQAGATTLATVAGALAGVAGGLDGFFNWGERIRIQRRTADRLKDEGTDFLTGQPPYDSDDMANLRTFKAKLAEIRREHRLGYDAARDEDTRGDKSTKPGDKSAG